MRVQFMTCDSNVSYSLFERRDLECIPRIGEEIMTDYDGCCPLWRVVDIRHIWVAAGDQVCIYLASQHTRNIKGCIQAARAYGKEREARALDRAPTDGLG